MGCAHMVPSTSGESTTIDTAEKKNSDGPAGFHEKYRLLGKLGKGAFAKVYLAQQIPKGEDGASPKLAAKITDLRARSSQGQTSERIDNRSKRTVEKEVEVLRRLDTQQNCVRFYEYFVEGPFSYVLMERCDYTLLQALERAPDVTEKFLFHIFHDMLQALASIHRQNVVHRDIKPDNFLCVGENGTVKLCDFGLAEVVPKDSPNLGGIYGTAPFMSPEMLASTGYGVLTDMWSFGVVVYVLSYGQFPYTPIERSAKGMKAAILSGVPAPAYKLKASLGFEKLQAISDSLKSLVRSLLHRTPSERLSANGALTHKWITRITSGKNSSEPEMPGPSLRPILYAAKRVGAFDVRNIDDDKLGDMDILLHMKQVQFHGDKAVFCGSPKLKKDKSGNGNQKGARTTRDNGNIDHLPGETTPHDRVKKMETQEVTLSGVTLSTGTGSYDTSRRSKMDSSRPD